MENPSKLVYPLAAPSVSNSEGVSKLQANYFYLYANLYEISYNSAKSYFLGFRRVFINNSHLNNSIQFVLENAVGFLYLAQWETVRDEWGGVYLALFN